MAGTPKKSTGTTQGKADAVTAKAQEADEKATDAAKAQDAAAPPNSKVDTERTSDGTPIDGKALENKSQAQESHPDEAPVLEEDESGGIETDAPKPVVGETDKEPESNTERFQMEAAPVAPPQDMGGVEPDALNSDAVPLDAPVEASSVGSDAPIAAGLGSGDLNDIAVGVGLRSNNGERTGGLVDEQGEPVNFEDVVDMGDGSKTNVVVTKRVYETFYLPGSFRPLTRLMYADGATITRSTAAKVIEASKAVQEA